MKIGFLCPNMGIVGGIQRVVTVIANELEQKHEIDIIVISDGKASPYYLTNENVNYKYLHECERSSNVFIRIVVRLLQKGAIKLKSEMIRRLIYGKKRVTGLEDFLNSNKYDCVIGVGPEYSILLSMIECANYKRIGWMHNSYDAYFKTRGKYYYGQEDLAVKQFKELNKLITLTRSDLEKYKENDFQHCICISNPLTILKNEEDDVAPEKILLFVGRLDLYHKGLDYLIEIASIIFQNPKSDAWKLLIVGDGKDKKKIQNLVKKEGLVQKVLFEGEQTNVEKYYKKASLLLMPSRHEGFGLVITEAMLFGVPTIAFEIEGPRDIIEHKKNGILISKYDIDSYAKTVLYFMENNIEREKMSNLAKDKASVYKIESIVKQWEKILKE